MRLLPWESKTKLKMAMEIKPPPPAVGYRFSLKGSPRHYDDVKGIIEADGGSKVYFGEALAYERGAGVALWRIRATNFDWLPPLYTWWANMERVEPIQFTIHLYFPDNPKYPAMDLRDHSAKDVAVFIKQQAPWDGRKPPSIEPQFER